MKEPNIKILVCCHKKDLMVTEEPYLPIQVGKSISKVNLGIQGDDKGDNISDKNPYYAELTAIYWAWKNLKDVDYIGLCHYRRYFDFHLQCNNQLSAFTVFHSDQFAGLDYSVPASVIKKLRTGSVIMANPVTFETTLYDQYKEVTAMRLEDLQLAEQIIKKKRNQDIVNAFDRVIKQGNQMRACNMFIMSWSQFDGYCKWLFGLFESMYENINFNELTNEQSRVFGFMGERLLNVYVEAMQYNIYDYPFIWFNDDMEGQKSRSILRVYKSLMVKTLKKFV